MNHLSLRRKIVILALCAPVVGIAMAGIAINGSGQLKYQYDNLYGFMLVPIMSLDQANLACEQAQGDIQALSIAGTDTQAALAEIKADDATLSGALQLYQTPVALNSQPRLHRCRGRRRQAGSAAQGGCGTQSMVRRLRCLDADA